MTTSEREEDHPLYYKGPLRTAAGERAGYQWGSHFTLGQATDLHTPPPRYRHDGRDYQMAIGSLALNDGTWLAYDAAEVPRRKHPRDPMGKSGGFAVYNRAFPTRDAATRANAALRIRTFRIQFRHHRFPDECPHTGWWQIDEARYRTLIGWVYEVLEKPAPTIYIPPPPAPQPSGIAAILHRLRHIEKPAAATQAAPLPAPKPPQQPSALAATLHRLRQAQQQDVAPCPSNTISSPTAPAPAA